MPCKICRLKDFVHTCIAYINRHFITFPPHLKKKGETQNKWMRARIYAQGFTILCIAYYTVRPGVKKQDAIFDEKKEAFENKKSPVVTIN